MKIFLIKVFVFNSSTLGKFGAKGQEKRGLSYAVHPSYRMRKRVVTIMLHCLINIRPMNFRDNKQKI